MKVQVLIVAGLLVTAPASAQEAATTTAEAGERVVVTAEDREETFQKQVAAERTAAEARRLFAELREGGGDRARACRTAAQADRDFVEAIQEARQLAKEAQPALQERIGERIKSMTERRDNLDDVQDRLCKGAGMTTRGPGERGVRGQGTGRRP